jgi:hypothetical protein
VLGGEKSTNGFTAWRLSPTATEWVDVEGGTSYSVRVVESYDGSLYLGGNFLTAGAAVPSHRIARLDPDPTLAPPHVAAGSLRQNHPNPFNPSTMIRFILAEPGEVRLDIYDAAGRRVRTLTDGHWPVGHHEIRWDGRDSDGRAVASGMYLYQLEAGGAAVSRKMVLVR